MLGCYFATKAPANFNSIDLKTLKRYTSIPEVEMELALNRIGRQKAIYFYEAQRSSPLPAANRVEWRGSSARKSRIDVLRAAE